MNIKIADNSVYQACLVIIAALLLIIAGIYGYGLGYIDAKRMTARLCVATGEWRIVSNGVSPDRVFDCKERKE